MTKPVATKTAAKKPAKSAAAVAKKAAPAMGRAGKSATEARDTRCGGEEGRAQDTGRLDAARGRQDHRTRAAAPRRREKTAVEAPHAVPGLSEEDQIRAAKYLPRELPKRLFEEERFLFPESYGQNRIRLLVRDPEWIFAHWDVKPQTLEELAKRLGERALALSRLTLRVVDPVSGGSSDILLPAGRPLVVRPHRLRAAHLPRRARPDAALGRVPPPGGEQHRRDAARRSLARARAAAHELSRRAASSLRPRRREAGRADSEARASRASRGRRSRSTVRHPLPLPSRERGARGGASDAFRPGGASDAFRR